MNQFFPYAEVRLDFIEAIAEHLRPALVEYDVPGRNVPVPGAEVGALQRQFQPLPGFVHIGQVMGDGVDCAVFVGRGGPPHQGMPGTVFVPVAVFKAQYRLTFGEIFHLPE